MTMPERRNLPRSVAAVMHRLRSGKLAASELGAVLGALATQCRVRGLQCRTVPSPATAPCLLWIYKKEIPQRLRQVARRSGTTRNYRMSSAKSDQHIECESDYEFDLACQHDVDYRVRRFFEQTPALLFLYEGTIHLYTPDFVVEWKGGGLSVFEVKPAEVSGTRRFMPSRKPRAFDAPLTPSARPSRAERQEADNRRLAVVAECYAKLGVEFRFCHADEIRQEPLRTNVAELFDHRYASVALPTRLALREYLRNAAQTTLGMLVERFGLSRVDLCALIARGEVIVDIHGLLDTSTPVLNPKEGALLS